jgi:hypothetical protein
MALAYMNKYSFIICLLLLSCKTIHYTSTTLPDKQLIVGTSGGFTGKESSFIITSSGQVFERIFPGDKMDELTGLKISKLKSLYKSAWKKTLKDYKYNKPGNLSHFVIFKDKGFENKITWASGDTVVSKDIKKLHTDLLNIINQKSNVK